MSCLHSAAVVRIVSLLFILLVVARPTPAAEELRQVTSVEGITEYRLDNGLKVLLFPDASQPTVTVNLTVFVGSRHEGYGEAGMAHLLEHMLFKGTPTHQDIPKALQDRGASFNGTTWLDRTNYYETLPAEGNNLKFAIRLEADRFVNSLIRKKDLDSEMTVVRNEFERGENNPRYILSQRMMSAAFEWHNYGKATIGNRADIERVPIDKLRAFYRKYYQPDNAMLIVAGKFDEDNALKLIRKYFGAIAKPKRELPNTYTEEPPQDGERMVTLRRVGDVPVVGTVYHICAGPHPDYPVVAVLNSLLTNEPSGRLYEALVKTKKAANIDGSAYALHDPGVVRFLATVNTSNDPRVVLDGLLDVLDETASEGVTAEEVDRAKRRLLKQWELNSTESRRIAIQLSEWAAQGDWRLYFLYRDRLEKVTKKDVDRVAAKYLKRTNRTVGLFLPTDEPSRAPIPETPSIAKMLKGYKGGKDLAAGEAFDVSPQNIEARTKRLTLSNGARLALLPKKTRGQTVILRLSLRYGNAGNLKGLATAADFLPDLMTRGTKNYSRQELQDALDKYKTQLSAGGSAGQATFTLKTKREMLPHALGLLTEILRRPTLPETELDILTREQIAGLQQRLANPQFLAMNAVQRKLSKYPKDDPRYVATIKEEIARTTDLTPTAVRRLYADYLGGEHAHLSVVGDFESKQVLGWAKETLVGWKGTKPYARLTRRGGSGKKGTEQTILTPDKANAVYFAALTFPMSDSHDHYPALTLGNFILGGGSLASRLGTRIRQKEGLSYGVGSGLNASSLDKRTAFYIYAISNPQNMPKVKAAVREELEKILKQGVTKEELNKAKTGYLQQLRVQRSSDSTLAALLSQSLLAERTMQYYAELEKNIRNVTPDDVLHALQSYIHPDRLHLVTAGDFPMADKKPETTTPEKKKPKKKATRN